MRKWLQSRLPSPESLYANRWLAPFASRLLAPDLWRCNRRSVAGAVAAGLFCGLIPGPLQMLGAALWAFWRRCNLPLAMAVTVYTNPLTIVPLYLLADRIGRLVVGGNAPLPLPPEFAWRDAGPWLTAMTDWLAGEGTRLAVGLLLLGTLLAVTGYVGVLAVWRLQLWLRWRHRAGARRARSAVPSPDRDADRIESDPTDAP